MEPSVVESKNDVSDSDGFVISVLMAVPCRRRQLDRQSGESVLGDRSSPSPRWIGRVAGLIIGAGGLLQCHHRH